MLFQELPISERIFRGSKYNLLTLNRNEIKNFVPNEECIVVSVTDPKSSDAEVFSSVFLLDILRLQFDDVVKTNEFKFSFEESSDIYFEANDANKIIAFARKYLRQANLIICQCEQGVSRSPAIAGALSNILQNEDEFFLKNYWANRWVYNLILEQNKKLN